MSIVPTRRLAIVAALMSVVALLLPQSVSSGVWGDVLRLNAVLLALAVVDWALAPRPANFSVERELPLIVALGGTAPITWRVQSGTRKRVRVHVADHLAPSLRAAARRFSLTLPGRGRGEVSTTIRPARRGRFLFRTVVVRAEGPLGFAAKQARLSLPGELRVYPSFRSKAEAELRIDKARILEVGLRSARGLGGGTDFDQLREYTVDDDSRRIDWGATARSGKAIVKTYRAELNQTVLVLLDNGRTMAGRVADVPRVEHAMDAVMALTTVATRLGDRCGLMVFDAEVRQVVSPARHREQLGRITEAMYTLEPELLESDYSGAFAQALGRFRRRALFVVVTDLGSASVGESLLPALPLLTRHHLLVVAGVRDPDIVGWAEAVPENAEQAYRKAAAAAALADRDRAAAKLRSLGVQVVDVAPGELAARLCDTYLQVKATGRL